MFNDLTQSNQSTQPNVPPVSPSVDDIFADTDKAAENNNFSGYYANAGATSIPTEVEAQKVGLSASAPLPTSSKGKILKIVLIALLVILLISLGYLVYAKFLSGQVAEEEIEKIDSPATKTVEIITPSVIPPVIEPIVEVPVSEEIIVSTSTPIETTTPPVSNLIDTDGDNLTDEEEGVLGTDINLKDSDDDGLSDYEEVKIYNTAANKVDTDSDGLSDYEEVKIYQTDPNKADSDEDGYSDGGEVKSGYNPLGDGKLTEVK